MASSCKNKCIFLLKWTTFLVCLLGFGKTVYEALLKATSGKTTMSFDLHEHPDGLDPPALTVCNKTGFKNVDKNLKLADYLANTLDFKSIYLGARNLNVENLYNLSLVRAFSTYSTYRGHCYTFNFDFKVFASFFLGKIFCT